MSRFQTFADCNRPVWRLAVAGVAALLIPGAALAQPARIIWSTYLRIGPGQGFGVIDELRHDTPIDLKSCSVRWCKIASGGISGFVDRDAVALPHLPVGDQRTGAGGACFIAGQDAWRGPAPTRFCQTQPETRP